MTNLHHFPINVLFRNFEQSDAVETKIREQAQKLGRYYDSIMGCHVVIEICHKHQHQGHIFHVRIDLTVPNAELVVSREIEDHAHENAYVAIRDAFLSMRRKLQTFSRKHLDMMKHPEKTLREMFAEIEPPLDSLE